MEDKDNLIERAIALLEVLAKIGAVMATGAFDFCDPCVSFIALKRKNVRPLMREHVREYWQRADHGETLTHFYGTFGFNVWDLSSLDEKELHDLADDLVRDLRYDEIEDLIVSRKGSITVPIP